MSSSSMLDILPFQGLSQKILTNYLTKIDICGATLQDFAPELLCIRTEVDQRPTQGIRLHCRLLKCKTSLWGLQRLTTSQAQWLLNVLILLNLSKASITTSMPFFLFKNLFLTPGVPLLHHHTVALRGATTWLSRPFPLTWNITNMLMSPTIP